MPKKKEYKQVSIRIPKDILENSNNLKKSLLKNDEFTFFRLHTSSQNAWDCWIYQMGIVKAKEEFEKFKLNLEGNENNEIQDSNRRQGI